MTDIPLLFTPLTIKGLTFKNRIVVSPMCQYSSINGEVSNWHLVHLGQFAIGGAGLIIMEATAIDKDGRISTEDTGLWSDDHIPKLSEITSFIKQHNSVPGIQLAHSGRKGSCLTPWKGDKHLSKEEGGWEIIAPSAIPFGAEAGLWRTPKELTVEEILEIQQKFVDSAERAVKAGFQVIDLHAANGYLINEFYSPLTNERTDNYGGTFENRIRFLTEIVTKIKAILPDDVLLFVRLNASDWDESGWKIEDAVATAKILKELSVDLIDVTSGFTIPNYYKIPFGTTFNLPFSEKVRNEVDIPTSVVGGITSGLQAEQILRDNKSDLIMIGREFLRNPHLPYYMASELNFNCSKQIFPVQYGHWNI